MTQSEASVALATPERFLTQLCAHFRHKLPVHLHERYGTIGFPAGTCALEATPDRLVMRVSAANEADRAQLEDVVARHLLRFAFRAPPEIVWAPLAA